MGLRFRLLGSGSSGNSTLVEGGSTRILLDAGLGVQALSERLQSAGVDPASIAAVFVSHEHQDHAKGAAAFSRRWGVRIHCTRGTHAAAGLAEEETAGWDEMEPGQPVAVGDLTVLGVPVPHDAAQAVGFVLASNGSSMAHVTDVGHFTRGMVERFRACDTILVESNYDPGMLREGPYPWSLKERILGPRGHLANEDVHRFLAQGLGEACRQVVLAHLSERNNHPEIARMSAEAALRRRGKTEVRLEIAGREGTEWLEVGSSRAAMNAVAPGPRQMRLFD